MILYDIAFIIFSVFYIPFSIYKKGFRGFNIRLRLGFMPGVLRDELAVSKNIWIHAVSVGEVMVLGKFIEGIKEQLGDYRIVISTTTKAGNDVAARLVSDMATVIYSPFDLSFAVKRFLNIIRPKALIIVETELWPNLIGISKRRNVPVVVINGRISPRSFPRYKAARPLLGPMLEGIDLFCMQGQTDADRMISIGAPDERVKTTGNMKFDMEVSPDKDQESMSKRFLGIADDEVLLVAGSTHKGEEEILLDAYKELSKEFKNMKLLIAPRHMERTKQVEMLAIRNGFKPRRVSRLAGEPVSGLNPQTRKPANPQTVFILDTIGRLRDFYSIADIVFVGGSLVRHGGQNPIEPAYFSKPVIFGPSMFNFDQMSQILLKAGAAVQIEDRTQLKNILAELIRQPARRRQMGASAKAATEQNKGASLKNIELIRGFL